MKNIKFILKFKFNLIDIAIIFQFYIISLFRIFSTTIFFHDIVFMAI